MAAVVLSKKLLQTIGELVVYHAEVEHWIDATVFALYTGLPGARRYAKKYPAAYADELKFLQDCLTKLPSMKPLRAQGMRLLKRLHDANDDRSHVVHSYVRAWDKKAKRLALMRTWKPRGAAAQMVRISLSEKALAADTKRISALRYAVHKFALRLTKICLPKNDAGQLLGHTQG